MIKINENFKKMKPNYLFSNIAKKVAKYQEENPDKKIIKMGIGDVTRPLPKVCTQAMKKAADELENAETFRGYGPEQGYDFLREKILENEYKDLGIDKDEIFISDGAKCDCGNIVDIFAKNNKIAITDPVYPVYLDTNIMAGRTGICKDNGMYENVIYIPMTEENNFVPLLPKEVPDIIYLCFPNNPTGTVLTKDELKVWVDYARKNKSIILFDAAYCAFIEEENIPKSIYEIEGAKDVAIEFKSYSKTAGFTGVRCAYVVIPKTVKGYDENGNVEDLNSMWNRRVCTKFNGVSYIVQRAAEAIYTKEGMKEVKDNINYYKENAKIILETLKECGIKAYGGKNSPYIWLKVPNSGKSWDFFDTLLEKVNIVGTPGEGFGPSGEGYFRLTAFNTKENTIEAMERLKNFLSK